MGPSVPCGVVPSGKVSFFNSGVWLVVCGEALCIIHVMTGVENSNSLTRLDLLSCILCSVNWVVRVVECGGCGMS